MFVFVSILKDRLCTLGNAHSIYTAVGEALSRVSLSRRSHALHSARLDFGSTLSYWLPLSACELHGIICACLFPEDIVARSMRPVLL